MQKRYIKTPTILLALSFFSFFITSSAHGMARAVDMLISTLHICCPRCIIYPDTPSEWLANAIDADSGDTIKCLSQRYGVDPNMPIGNEAPVIRAARLGKCEALNALLSLGAHPDSQYHDHCNGSYPSTLIAACLPTKQSPETVARIVTTLLQRGANPALTASLLTEQEEKERAALQEKREKEEHLYLYMQTPKTAEYRMLAPRTALDFAQLNNYVHAAELLRTAKK